MLSKQIQDIKKRRHFYKKEKNILIQKYLQNQLLSYKNVKLNNVSFYRLLLSIKMNNRKASKVKLIRRCVITNRSRGSLRKFKISRIFLREMLLSGAITGYKKAVW